LYDDSWDSLSFNKKEYYDIWALSIRPYMFSFMHYKDGGKVVGDMKNYVENLLASLPPNTLLKCASAFNGFAIYKTRKFLNCKYDGSPRLDLIPSSFLARNAKANNSHIVLNKTFGEANSINEDCEHRAFHLDAIRKNNARIRISPDILFP
jgi:hypothetical protein